MGVFKTEEISGYRFENGIVCAECAEDAEKNEAKQDEIILWAEVETSDVTFFCDRCKEQI